MEEGRNRGRLIFGVCAGVLAVLVACAGTAAGATWVVDDGGAGYVDTDGSADFVRIPREVAA